MNQFNPLDLCSIITLWADQDIFRRNGVLRYEEAEVLREPEQAILPDAHAGQILCGAQSDEVAL